MAASLIHLYLCKNYPFTDNTNVFDQESSNHGIANFVSYYNTNGGRTIFNVSDININAGVCRVALTYEQADDYNYMYFTKNNRTYYCFIDSIVWESNLNTATISFHVDPWNTYRDDITLYNSFIEREHVQNDTFGLHTIDEGIAPSEYKTYIKTDIGGGDMLPFVAVGSNNHIFRDSPATPATATPARAIEYSDGYGYNPLLLGIRNLTGWTRESAVVEISKIVRWLTDANSADAIIGIYLLPVDCVTKKEDVYIVKDLESGAMDNYEAFSCYVALYPSSETIANSNYQYNKPSTINGYTPKNQKCFMYPFNMLNISNKMGNELTLKFEKSENPIRISLNVRKDGNINGAMYAVAHNYDGNSGNNLDYSIQSMNYPTVPFVIDTYDSYMSANKNMLANSKNYIENDYNFQSNMNTATSEIAKGVTSANQLFSGIGNVMGASGSGSLGAAALSVGKTLLSSEIQHGISMESLNLQQRAGQINIDYNAEKARDSLKASLADIASKPDKYCGRYIPNLLLFYYNWGFTVKYTGVMAEQLESIDDYFTRYGYKVSRYSAPYLWYRPYFDYKKIPDCNITGAIPNNALNQIKAIFQNGVTIWHNRSRIFNYSGNQPSPGPN